jgi:hypothetical protein
VVEVRLDSNQAAEGTATSVAGLHEPVRHSRHDFVLLYFGLYQDRLAAARTFKSFLSCSSDVSGSTILARSVCSQLTRSSISF